MAVVLVRHRLSAQRLSALVAQADAPHLDGRYPTSSWDTSEVVSDPRQLSLPPNLLPGHYTVLAGWYLPSSGERLTVTPPQSDDAVPVAEVDVGA